MNDKQNDKKDDKRDDPRAADAIARDGTFDQKRFWAAVGGAKYQLQKILPYYASAVNSMPVMPAWWTNTICSDEHWNVFANPDAFFYTGAAGVSASDIRGFQTFDIAHELEHLVRGTIPRGRRLGATTAEELKLSNFAADFAINHDLRAAGFKVPNVKFEHVEPDGTKRAWEEKPLFADMFSLPLGLTHEAYYKLLRDTPALRKKISEMSSDLCLGPGRGCCFAPPGSIPSGAPAGMSSLDIRTTRAAVAAAISGAGAGRGSADQQTWIAELLAPSKVRWQDLLLHSIRGALNFAALRRSETTYVRPHRKQAGLGHGAGSARMPVLAGFDATGLLCLDTSGSMSSAENQILYPEILSLLEYMGAGCEAIAVDTNVKAAVKVTEPGDVQALFRGGGGTVFRPFFDYAEKMEPRPSFILICTDGQCYDTPEEPDYCEVIWLLVGRHAMPPCDWGTQIMIRDLNGSAEKIR